MLTFKTELKILGVILFFNLRQKYCDFTPDHMADSIKRYTRCYKKRGKGWNRYKECNGRFYYTWSNSGKGNYCVKQQNLGVKCGLIFKYYLWGCL